MYRLIGISFLMLGSIGLGCSVKNRMKERLSVLQRMLQIFKMLQNEILYSKATIPEACLRISRKTEEPFQTTFCCIYDEMLQNNGESFENVWKKNMKICLSKIPISGEDKRICLSFGSCAGFLDGRMQADALEQYMHGLTRSMEEIEKEIVNKSKVIMSLSVMGGLLAVIILL